ncbi:hypothetical protein MUN89_12865 [Halobacillus salinarum]|uniref:Uncharacterized protein n=1 Tax=Halobacillus salinarum TaxID=2932257 RepID=A0ABY4EFL2_9BACI|nr:hypothetical protein [Halobacillus salinarum]UOQ42853.1 hypothetical protein MUN89_12865 [Halobacillus salinarum]
MRDKLIWIPLSVSIGTMALLYLVGNVFDFSFLRLNIDFNEPLEKGFIVDADMAIFPFAIGLAAGFITERRLKAQNAEG